MRGRPPKPPAEVRSVVVFFRLTPGEAVELDARRGSLSRGEFARRRAIGGEGGPLRPPTAP